MDYYSLTDLGGMEGWVGWLKPYLHLFIRCPVQRQWKQYKFVCTTTNQPHTKSNPNPIPNPNLLNHVQQSATS